MPLDGSLSCAPIAAFSLFIFESLKENNSCGQSHRVFQYILTAHKIGSKWQHVATPWRIERNRIYAVTVNVMCREWQVSSEEIVHHFKQVKAETMTNYSYSILSDLTRVFFWINRHKNVILSLWPTWHTINQKSKSSNYLKCMERAIRINIKW